MKRKLPIICLLLLAAPVVAYANPVILMNPFPMFLMFAILSIPAILAEVAIETLLLRSEKGWKKTALILLAINFVTVVMLMMILSNAYPLSLAVYLGDAWGLAVWIAEIGVVLVESLLFRFILKSAYSRCLLASLLGNIASYGIGYVMRVAMEAILF